MTTITVQRTSKWLKAAMLFSLLTTAGSLGVMASYWGQPWGQLGSYGAAAGVAMWALTRFIAWWQYG